MLRLWPAFEEAGELGIFSVPESREKLGIFPRPRAYTGRTVRRVTPRQHAAFEEGGSSEFF